MNTSSLILSFIFGAVVGSFLNVVAIRFNTGKNIGGRSKCMSCSKTLEWFELVPIFSFIFQRGACKKCKSKISWQYPLVEFIAGAIFVLLFFTFPPISYISGITTFIQILCACLLLVIVIYDIKHKIIPDSFVYSFDIIALLGLFIGGISLWHIPTFSQLIAGPLLAIPFAFLWLISGGKWMGFGDAKLVLGIGWLLGINAGINAIILSFWIGAIVSVAWLFVNYKTFKRNVEIPFGPYLVLGMYLVLIFGIQVINLDILLTAIGFS
ncbi:MAG: prepilin peptidase [Candidatus Paceibacterota bacterium]|jgi:prepilin signal peptidase PulO-like enzyme (type II secretory pathway)